MENQTKTRMTMLGYLKEYANSFKEFAKALVGNDDDFVNDIETIPDLEEYKNKNAKNEDIQKDIEELTKIQKALEKKKAQVQKAKKNLNEQIKNPQNREVGKQYKVIEEREKEY